MDPFQYRNSMIPIRFYWQQDSLLNDFYVNIPPQWKVSEIKHYIGSITGVRINQLMFDPALQTDGMQPNLTEWSRFSLHRADDIIILYFDTTLQEYGFDSRLISTLDLLPYPTHSESTNSSYETGDSQSYRPPITIRYTAPTKYTPPYNVKGEMWLLPIVDTFNDVYGTQLRRALDLFQFVNVSFDSKNIFDAVYRSFDAGYFVESKIRKKKRFPEEGSTDMIAQPESEADTLGSIQNISDINQDAMTKSRSLNSASKELLIGLCVTGSLILLFAVCLCVWFVAKRHKRKDAKIYLQRELPRWSELEM